MEDGQRTRCPVGRLERAVGLLDRGLVSGREFEVLKRHILAELQSATEVEDEEEDGVACLGAPGEPPGGGSWPGNARSAPSAVRSRRCASKRRVPSGGPCYGAHLGGQRGADEGAHSWWTHDDLFSMHVLQFLDMENALRCREVCSRWKRCVAAVGLEPLESGKSGEEVEAGRQEQQLLRAALRREGELWADEEHARIFRMLSNDLEQQHGLNARMRQILVDWLLELHWNTFVTYLEHSSLVQLAVQLVDRFIARMQVQRSNFQAVGAVAFGMVCASSQYAGLALTERHCSIVHTLYPGDDFRVTKEYLIYMCANAFTQREFDKIENEMMCFLRQAPVIPAASQNKGGSSESRQESARHCDSGLVGAYVVKAHPRPTDFLPRFIKAAGFDPLSTLSSTTGYTPTRIVIFFLDVILIRAHFCRYRASQIAAACVMAAQRIWHRRCGHKSLCDWGPRLTYYSGCTREEIAPVADSAMAEATDVSAKVIAGQQPPPAIPDPSGPSRVDQDVGSFSKRYCIDFVTMIHNDLVAHAAALAQAATGGRATGGLASAAR